MVGAFGNHGPDHSQLVGAPRQMRQQIANPQAARAALFELEPAGQQVARLSEERRHIEGRSTALDKLWFVIEAIEVAHAADTEDLDYPLYLRPEVRLPVRAR